MSTTVSTPQKKFRSYVPDSSTMPEFTLRAVLLGLVLTVILGAANAYLGLRAGMTIAATYPAAVIGMAVLRIMKGSILEENIARTVGSIGESVAAGAIFTIPAFVISGAWPVFDFEHAYWKSSILMLVGGALGILFVTLLRRVMVEDPELPFPESVAASQIHIAGQQGSRAAKILFGNMGFGGIVYLLGQFSLFSASRDFIVNVGTLGTSFVRMGRSATAAKLPAGAVTTMSAPAISPAYLGVGYIIGPRLASLNFAGGVIAWGLLVPLILFLGGPTLVAQFAPAGTTLPDNAFWAGQAGAVWSFIVRPIAVGGMLVGACYTLFRMRKSLGSGMARAVSDLKKSAAAHAGTARTERDLNAKFVFSGLLVVLISMVFLYKSYAASWGPGIVAAIVMIIVGFFFAAVSGNLVGLIGSSNNPISGLTLAALVIAALLMVLMGVSGIHGVAAVLGVAAVVCISSAVAGEMLQDLKVGHILGGTPAKMQIGDFMGVTVASFALLPVLLLLNQANINSGGIGFGDRQLPAPQAGLMAMLSRGIVGGEMAWPLIVVGILMGIALIMIEVRSPMLFAVGMYLPLETTFAIFLGGMIRWITDKMRDSRNFNEAQKARVENAGVLTASGFIAGEALMGIVIAVFKYKQWPLPVIFQHPNVVSGFIVLVILAVVMIRVPLANAGRPDEPAPPTAIM
ncbi:MAG TPA: oligopeptide transporter, OPT family [Candidatus Limnocylindrales bacterium]|nr:oligopeptide transporter, OPT family [Candidatus Limnocylindrales bacterium]